MAHARALSKSPSVRVAGLLLAWSAIWPRAADAQLTHGAQPDTFRAAHFTFVQHAADTAALARLADALERDRGRIVADLGGAAAPTVTVHMHADHAALQRAVASLVGPLPAWARGLATGPRDIHVVAPRDVGQAIAQDVGVLLAHEFAHCVSLFRNPGSHNNPRWLWESVAVYEAGSWRDPRTLPYMMALHPPAFSMLNAFDNGLVYDVGYTIAEFVVKRWGKAALIRLIDTNARTDDVLGITPEAFERDWFAWVRRQYNF